MAEATSTPPASGLVARFKQVLHGLGTDLLMIMLGVVAVRGYAPHAEWLTFMLAITVMMAMAATSSWRRGFRLGFWFGVGHYGWGFYWLINSLHGHGGLPLPGALAMLLGLAAIIGLYTGLFGALLGRMGPGSVWFLLGGPSLWAFAEWLRSWVFSGFPWNLAGYVWDGQLQILQVAELVGVYGLSWLAIWGPAVAVWWWFQPSDVRINRLLWAGPLVVVPLVMVHLYGGVRIVTLDALPKEPGEPLRVALVQPNIPQHEKWDRKLRQQNLDIHFKLSEAIKGPVDLLVWPETALTFFYHREFPFLMRFNRLLQKMNTTATVGAPVVMPAQEGDKKYFNSLLVFDKGNMVPSRRYDKHHLVPFGEYLPFRGIIPDSITKFTQGSSDFSTGPGPQVMSFAKGALGPLICYEAIFPGEVAALGRQGAKWLLNVTN
ncbi:MAG: apolipoprotein N-acyltransferase, partial [Magnetococcales bacterium]|nr:apolipoprotein N-acyltransferase [Magnetococcales bacterium]